MLLQKALNNDTTVYLGCFKRHHTGSRQGKTKATINHLAFRIALVFMEQIYTTVKDFKKRIHSHGYYNYFEKLLIKGKEH